MKVDEHRFARSRMNFAETLHCIDDFFRFQCKDLLFNGNVPECYQLEVTDCGSLQQS
jgi:hypothetical protein